MVGLSKISYRLCTVLCIRHRRTSATHYFESARPPPPPPPPRWKEHNRHHVEFKLRGIVWRRGRLPAIRAWWKRGPTPREFLPVSPCHYSARIVVAFVRVPTVARRHIYTNLVSRSPDRRSAVRWRGGGTAVRRSGLSGAARRVGRALHSLRESTGIRNPIAGLVRPSFRPSFSISSFHAPFLLCCLTGAPIPIHARTRAGIGSRAGCIGWDMDRKEAFNCIAHSSFQRSRPTFRFSPTSYR